MTRTTFEFVEHYDPVTGELTESWVDVEETPTFPKNPGN